MKLNKTTTLFSQQLAIKRSAFDDLLLEYAAKLKAGVIMDNNEPSEPLQGKLVNGVFVLPIFGILGNHVNELGLVDYQDIRSELQGALGNADVETTLLYINSPGGWTQGMFTIAGIVDDITIRKPIYTYVDGMCCSAAYIGLASQTTAIYCSQDSDIGSIGTFLDRVDTSKMLADMGITHNVFASHPDKVADHAELPLSDEHKKMFQEDTNIEYERALQLVQSKRNIPEDKLRGWCYKGMDSVGFGFADGIINTIDEAIAFIAEKQTVSVE